VPDSNLPSVTLLVAMRNEAPQLERCLASVLAQEYPAERLEIVVADGRSTDGSADIAASLLRGHGNARLIDNARITQAAGWNMGIDQAAGDVVGIVSGHVELAPDYIRSAVEALTRTGADMVGGPVRAMAEGMIGDAVSRAVSSPFGVGNARFRYTTEEEEVDTVFMGLCWRETYLRLRFDEEMVRNQDDEFSYRLLDEGGRIVCDPAIRASYRNRATLRELASQYFQYGYWKVRVIQKHPRQVRARQLAPPALVASTLAGILLTPISRRARRATLALAGLYGTAAILAAWRVGRTASPGVRLALPVVFGTLHYSYGFGFLLGLVKFRGGWPSPARDGAGRRPALLDAPIVESMRPR
jgi:succinoglycan biosynthesis protein ExoA